MKILQILSLSVVYGSSHISTEQVRCSREHTGSALAAAANCSPRPRVIRLTPPVNMTVETMTPQYVTGLRCGGSCPSSSHSCVPTKTKQTTVAVIIANCGLESGVCEKQCHTVTIQEELECACDCLQQQRACGPMKVFRSEGCSCQCVDLTAAKACKDSGRIWESDSCKCGCPAHLILPCSTGFEYDNTTCSCLETFQGKGGNEVLEPEGRVLRNSFHGIKVGSIEMIIIAVLSSVIVLLLLIMAVLINAVSELRRRLYRSKMAIGQGEETYYFPCNNPTPEDGKYGGDCKTSDESLASISNKEGRDGGKRSPESQDMGYTSSYTANDSLSIESSLLHSSISISHQDGGSLRHSPTNQDGASLRHSPTNQDGASLRHIPTNQDGASLRYSSTNQDGASLHHSHTNQDGVNLPASSLSPAIQNGGGCGSSVCSFGSRPPSRETSV